MTAYYKIENRSQRAYEMSHDGTILAINGDSEWLLESRFTGMDQLRGGRYREFIHGYEQAWPKAAEKAIDKTDEIEKYMDRLTDEVPNAMLCDLSAYQIRQILGL